MTPAERSRERAGPSSVRARTAACRTPSTAASTRSRPSRPSRTAGEPRLPVRHVSERDKWPRLPVAPRALPGAFRPKRPEVPRDETRERNAEHDPVHVPVSPSRVTGREATAPDPGSRTVHNRLSSRSLFTEHAIRNAFSRKTKTTRRPRRPRRGVAVRHRVGCAAAAVRGLPPPAQEQELQVRRGEREGGRRRVRRAEVQVRLRDLASRGGADEGEAVGGRGFVSVARLAETFRRETRETLRRDAFGRRRVHAHPGVMRQPRDVTRDRSGRTRGDL